MEIQEVLEVPILDDVSIEGKHDEKSGQRRSTIHQLSILEKYAVKDATTRLNKFNDGATQRLGWLIGLILGQRTRSDESHPAACIRFNFDFSFVSPVTYLSWLVRI